MPDRPPPAEIEVTDAMIKAGMMAYSAWDRRFEEPEGLVDSVFRAMLAEKYQE